MKNKLLAGLFLLVGTSAFAANDIVLLSNGGGDVNAYSGELPEELLEWCDGQQAPCYPTVQLTLEDARTGVPKGILYAWGGDTVFGIDGSFCFQEFVLWDLKPGKIYTQTLPEGGACGNTVEAVEATGDPANGVIAGGGKGEVVGGTGAFANWSGTYVTRVFVETDSDGNFVYYDYLFAKLSGSNAPID
jgi:hypothetical protein